jgi:hypothetical protein
MNIRNYHAGFFLPDHDPPSARDLEPVPAF